MTRQDITNARQREASRPARQRQQTGRALPAGKPDWLEIVTALSPDVPVTEAGKLGPVLEALVARPGAILSRAQLEERLYGWGEEVESNAVEVFIHGLRKKLGAEFIRTVRGVGYMVPKTQ